MAVVFIVEDDRKIRTELTKLLEKYGYDCVSSDDFSNMPAVILEKKPQLVLLDINLPVFDGYYICREIRKQSQVPIIIVTSRDNEVDELMSMNFGADDFVTKPFNMQILLARISAVLKRTYPVEPVSVITHREVEVDLSKGTAKHRGAQVELTKNELRILRLLVSNPGRIIPRDEIMNDLWQSEEFVDDNTLTVNINRLRRKLESIGVTDYLITKRGQGYLV
ncbi:MAG TPA: response regulator transcription factor [Caproiciproducens sp.]|nr:response regulator transcription factor [Caproiciproducens sp.]